MGNGFLCPSRFRKTLSSVIQSLVYPLTDRIENAKSDEVKVEAIIGIGIQFERR